MTTTISLNDCLQLVYQYPGIVLGPTATSHANLLAEMTDKIILQFPDPKEVHFSDHYAAADALRQVAPDQLESAETTIRDYLLGLAPAAAIHHLARGRWGLAVSLTPDLLFEDALRAKLETIASSWTVTLIDHPSVIPTGQTIPVYKLLGNARDTRRESTLAIGQSDLLLRRQYWRAMLRTLADYLRDAPLLFVGTDTIIPLVRDFLSEVFALDPPYPSRLVFLMGDGTPNDPTVQALASRYSTLVQVDATTKDFCDATATLQPQRLQATASQAAARLTVDNKLMALSSRFRALVDIVPSSLAADFDVESNRLRIIDALFRPTSLDWSPFLADFDLPRDDVARITAAVNLKIDYLHEQPHPTILLRGEAGIGKSTTAKRAAVALAKDGKVVLWCKRPPAHGGISYRQLARGLQEWHRTAAAKGKSIVVVCDDPWGTRVSPSELVGAFDSAEVPAVFVFVARNSDYLVQEGGHQILPTTPDETLELAYQLSTNEIGHLKLLLVRVGAALSESDAQDAISRVQTKAAEDILCSLWYLLPRTRASLSSAIQDEYCRLGGVTGAIEGFATAASELGSQARIAYECVAVASNLDIGLPLEVMLRAAGMNYSEWRDVSHDGKPLWGLLYDDIEEESHNIVFFTRNEVVTRVLVGLVNGGIGHAGEFRVLKQIVGACTIGTPPYRSALIDILVRGRRKLEKILTFEQGVELYELAFETFPEQDRALRHHFGLWIRDTGRDAPRAYEEYHKALETEDYRYSSKTEPTELIHTSMAAAVVENVTAGQQDRGTGLEMVREHLRQASNPRFFNPYTAHVFANLLFRLSQQGGPVPEDTSVSIESVAEALHTIERMLQIIGAEGRKRIQFASNIQMLTELQSNILSAVDDIDELRSHAFDLLSRTGQQTGCEVVGRKLLHRAMSSDRGSDYKAVFDYLKEVEGKVAESRQELAVGLLALRVDLIVRWRLQRTRGPVEWEPFRDDLERVLASSKYRDDFIKMYYHGVSLFQCGDYTKGNVVFEKMRTQIRPNRAVSRGLRNFFVGKEGFPRRFQGTLKMHHERYSVYCPDLATEIFVNRPPSGARNEATIHFYIAFSMYGPVAVSNPPDENQLLLP